MILTCPECATSYFVDDSRIPPQGRRVKCSSCGHRWTAGPDGPIAEQSSVAPAAAEPAVEAEPEPEVAAPEADLEAVPAEVEPAPVRRPAAARRGRSARAEARSSALVWAGAAALAAALIAGAIVFREQVVRLWPKSSAAYAGLGLAVDGGGLVLEQVHVAPAFLAGHPVLSVTGAIRNVRDVPVNAPPVRVTLLNRAGKPVAAKIARPMDATIPARAKRHFVITMLDPPATARDLEVRFETAGDAKTEPRAAEAVLSPAPAAAPAAAAPPAPPPGPHLSPAAATEHG
jgi:predicted Zn finger-like uncharacterized protein